MEYTLKIIFQSWLMKRLVTNYSLHRRQEDSIWGRERCVWWLVGGCYVRKHTVKHSKQYTPTDERSSLIQRENQRLPINQRKFRSYSPIPHIVCIAQNIYFLFFYVINITHAGYGIFFPPSVYIYTYIFVINNYFRHMKFYSIKLHTWRKRVSKI